MLGNLKDKFEPQNFDKLNLKEFDELERFILHKIYHISKAVETGLKNYNFHKP